MKLFLEEIEHDIFLDVTLDMKEYLKLLSGELVNGEFRSSKSVEINGEYKHERINYYLGIKIDEEEEYV